MSKGADSILFKRVKSSEDKDVSKFQFDFLEE